LLVRVGRRPEDVEGDWGVQLLQNGNENVVIKSCRKSSNVGVFGTFGQKSRARGN